jgi:Protein O-mannosyl-transferase TMEM260-like
VTPRRSLLALALVFALAHIPFLATSLEDIDSVNFALGVRHFDVATHRPHPPGYPVYIAAGKIAVGALDLISDAPESSIDARALAILSLLAGVAAIGFLYRGFASLTASGNPFDPSTGSVSSRAQSRGDSVESGAFDLAQGKRLVETINLTALAATAITISCPLFWYLAVRPMSDLPGFAVAIAAQACLLTAWWRQTPASTGERRLSIPALTASGRMIVLGALLSAIAIGVRSQTVWFTVPLLLLVLFDRIGRGVAGAILGSAVSFLLGALAWGVPLIIASGGLASYLAALGSQAGEDFAAGEMLYLNPTPRNAAFALVRTFVHPWDSPALATVVLALAAFGFVQVAWRERRTMAAVLAMTAPYLVFHLVFQDTSFVRYALPIVPPIAFLAARGVALASEIAAPMVAAAISIWSVAVASPVLVAYAADASPTVRVIAAMQAEAARQRPGALALHQTFRRPLEAEEVGIEPVLPSPPRLEWLEWAKYWLEGHTESLWMLADPVRSDLALVDPQSRHDVTDIQWPLVARPAFGGMRPSAVRWYRLPPPGWFVEEGWALTPETAGMAGVMGKGPSIAPISARVRRRSEAARLLIGGRNLAPANHPAARVRVAIDDTPLQEFEAAPGFFLHVVDIPPGRLAGDGAFAQMTVQAEPVNGGASIPTAIEQFDVQNTDTLMWGFDTGWYEAEYSPALGVWRWSSDKSTLRIVGPARAIRLILPIENPTRYFDRAPHVRVMAGEREVASTTVGDTTVWTVDVPADAVAAAGGLLTIETDETFVPAERGGPPDFRRLGLRIFGVQVQNSLTPGEANR